MSLTTATIEGNALVPLLDGSIKRILKLLFDCIHYFPLRFISVAEPFISMLPSFPSIQIPVWMLISFFLFLF
jgi:hypothetical protein